jgi:DNA-directed RNA polymerase specialized sigma24 family protein
MEEKEALAALVGPDEAKARQALDCLFRSAADSLSRYAVRELQVQPADAADVVQQVFMKTWRSRSRLEFLDGASWQ